MTIDAKQFAAGMSLLADTYGKLVEAPLAAFYKQTLDPLMTTEEFVAAVHAVAATERFWPTPAVLVDKVRPGCPKPADAAKLEGAEIFDRIRSECGHYTPLGVRVDVVTVETVFGTPAVMALRAIGGPVRYRYLTETNEAFVRKDFADAYATALGILVARGETPQGQLSADPRVTLLIAAVAPKLVLPKTRTSRQLSSGNQAAHNTGR